MLVDTVIISHILLRSLEMSYKFIIVEDDLKACHPLSKECNGEPRTLSQIVGQKTLLMTLSKTTDLQASLY